MLQSEITTPINITPSKKARPAKWDNIKILERVSNYLRKTKQVIFSLFLTYVYFPQ